MNKLILFLSLVVFGSISAQVKLSSSQASSLKSAIISKSKSTQSIKSNFVQLKHLDFLSKDIKSTGKLVFKSPDLIKWEYQSPYKYKIVFKNKTLYIDDNGKKSDVDLSKNKTFKSLNEMIVKSIKGDMFDESKFSISYYKSGSAYLIKFSPKDAKIKKYFKEFNLTFEAKSYDVETIKMVEPSGDYTTISFSNQVKNAAVSNAEFTL